MKKYFFRAAVLLLLIFTTSVQAQQLTPATISSGGNTSTNGSVMLESSVGGLVVETVSTPTIIYTQGFLQPDAGTVTSLPPINDVVLNSGAGIDNAGTSFINGGIMLEFTTGEFVSVTLNSPGNMLTQGILQPRPTNLWTGLVNTDWINTGNWSAGVIPTPIDDVVIPAGCPHYPVITNGIIAECRSITLNAGSSASVNTGGKLKIYK